MFLLMTDSYAVVALTNTVNTSSSIVDLYEKSQQNISEQENTLQNTEVSDRSDEENGSEGEENSDCDHAENVSENEGKNEIEGNDDEIAGPALEPVWLFEEVFEDRAK